MGWYGTSEPASRDEIKAAFCGLVPGYEYRAGVTVTDATWRGTVLWGVARENGAPVSIICWLTDRRRVKGSTSAWAYKPLEETCGPAETSCPLRLLDMVPCPDSEWARAWRERVRADASRARERGKVRRSLVVGDRITSGGDSGVVVALTYRGRRAIIADFPNYRGSGVTRRFRVIGHVELAPSDGPCLCGERPVGACGNGHGCEVGE